MEKQQAQRVYVKVDLEMDENGRMIPTAVTWTDGRRYPIGKIIDCRPAAAKKAGGQGQRYTFRDHGKEKHLFFERSPNVTGDVIGRWFVEYEAV